jgi:hypothetical protein
MVIPDSAFLAGQGILISNFISVLTLFLSGTFLVRGSSVDTLRVFGDDSWRFETNHSKNSAFACNRSE